MLGGVSRGGQVKRLAGGVDVLVATPGRLTDLVSEGAVNLAETRWLVLDEADRMLDMGFIHAVRRLARATHPERQTALFSATMPAEIAELAAGLLKDPLRAEVAPQGTTAAEIRQSVVLARTRQKRHVLSRMLADPAMASVIVFARTKHGADRVTRDLERDGFQAAVIHGNKSQNARQKALSGFRDGQVRILVATDIAARGIDVPGISHVVNFDLPDEAESYVHRIGRTGRNGASGIAVTLCDPAEGAKLQAGRAHHPDASAGDGRPHRRARPGAGDPCGAAGRAAKATPHAANDSRPARKPAGDKPFRGKPNGAKKPFRGRRRGGFGRKPAARAA